MTKKEIKAFLDTYGTRVQVDEDDGYVELMMDDHSCIRWQGVEWYIKRSHMMYTQFETEIADHLHENHHV